MGYVLIGILCGIIIAYDAISDRKGVQKMYCFMAENIYDAVNTVWKWVDTGVLPNGKYSQPQKLPGRPGYWFVRKIG